MMIKSNLQPRLLLWSSILVSFIFLGNTGIGFCVSEHSLNLPADKIVARVNHQPILGDQLNSAVKNALQAYSRFGMKKVRPELISTLQRQSLDRLIDHEILSQAIRAFHVPDIDSKAEQKLSDIKTRYKDQKAFERYLKYRHLNTTSLLADLRSNIQKKAYLESAGLARFQPDEKNIRSFYERNKKTFKKKERVHVRQILVQVADDEDPSQKEAARLHAETILKKIHEGEDFARLAGQYSDCQRSKDKGGDLGFIQRGFMPVEFDKIAFTLDKGKTSPVFATQFGYHIIQVLDHEPAGSIPLENVRDFIKKYFEQQKLKKMLSRHIKTLKKQAEIKIFI